MLRTAASGHVSTGGSAFSGVLPTDSAIRRASDIGMPILFSRAASASISLDGAGGGGGGGAPSSLSTGSLRSPNNSALRSLPTAGSVRSAGVGSLVGSCFAAVASAVLPTAWGPAPRASAITSPSLISSSVWLGLSAPTCATSSPPASVPTSLATLPAPLAMFLPSCLRTSGAANLPPSASAAAITVPLVTAFLPASSKNLGSRSLASTAATSFRSTLASLSESTIEDMYSTGKLPVARPVIIAAVPPRISTPAAPPIKEGRALGADWTDSCWTTPSGSSEKAFHAPFQFLLFAA